jgi:hypothetical protein
MATPEVKRNWNDDKGIWIQALNINARTDEERFFFIEKHTLKTEQVPRCELIV